MAEASNSSSNMVNDMHSDPELGPRIANMLFETVQEKRKRVRELEAKCEKLIVCIIRCDLEILLTMSLEEPWKTSSSTRDVYSVYLRRAS